MIHFKTCVTALMGLFFLTGCEMMGSDSSQGDKPTGPAVTITADANTYTLDNGIVTARVARASGDLVSLKYKGMEMLATRMDATGQPDLNIDPPGENKQGLNAGMTDHQYGFWSHDAMGPRGTGDAVATVTIDPAANSGDRTEVSVKGISNGRLMGTGPGAQQGGNFIADIDIRWTLDRGASGVYTYCTFEHQPQYATTTITEARFCYKLADMFDWMLVDQHHNKLYPKDAVENKYDYTTVQFDHRAYGWASTTKNVGCFLMNPSMEYMSGGPTKVEFECHRDINAVAAPTVLNYWRSSHYGGAGVTVRAGEHWTKVVGPFMIYCNAGSDPQAMWKDALAQQVKEEARWPFDWVNGVDYPHKDQRSTVKGQLVLTDPIMPDAKMSRLLVGLTHPAYENPGPGPARAVDWQTDAKNYEFWVRGENDGRFSIPNVRAGTYTMHAFADGVLGEYAKADVTIEPGKSIDLGKLTWTPVRRGKQVWEVGIPNRNGSEFVKGDDYFHDGMGIVYAQMFPNDVNYVIGKSDFKKDWYFQQVPHADEAAIATYNANRGRGRGLPGFTPPARGPATQANGAPATQPGGRGRGRGGFGPPPIAGKDTPWPITFVMANAPSHGKATLRAALSGAGIRAIDVSLNGEPIGQVNQLTVDNVMGTLGNGIQGIWQEHELSFDASKLKAGSNVIKLTVPAGPLTAGIIYDYLRLELDEAGTVAAAN